MDKQIDLCCQKIGGEHKGPLGPGLTKDLTQSGIAPKTMAYSLGVTGKENSCIKCSYKSKTPLSSKI